MLYIKCNSPKVGFSFHFRSKIAEILLQPGETNVTIALHFVGSGAVAPFILWLHTYRVQKPGLPASGGLTFILWLHTYRSSVAFLFLSGSLSCCSFTTSPTGLQGFAGEVGFYLVALPYEILFLQKENPAESIVCLLQLHNFPHRIARFCGRGWFLPCCSSTRNLVFAERKRSCVDCLPSCTSTRLIA
ncbi:hypothetical protein HMPREF1981_03165 [Bacteroides pyogenes F0041]|uniref:Uncharacterized protein n=1 Tax=Bacteroides pyogenes F0041 TaxID=1321819 RepID=U2DJ17_9BACE|nr:hypothetical protein HMPREF1981_03165 [Bacteroides pyogenes F0041]